jgi:hypothetical protein
MLPPRPRRWPLWTLAALLLAVTIYAFAIEPYRIEVTRHQVRLPVRSPIKIAHLTDLHSRGLGRRERALLAHLAAEAPDLIVVTGDSLAERGDLAQAGALLGRLQAPLGVWLVRGNWENWQRQPGERERLQELGVHLLVNEARPVRPDLWLVGLDDALSGHPEDAAFAAVPPGTPCVALFHAPGYFDRGRIRCPLSLSGHTHGGQVTLPLFGPIWLPPGSSTYVAGWYSARGRQMYVSRGIGTSILDVRFLCPPELVILTLTPP